MTQTHNSAADLGAFLKRKIEEKYRTQWEFARAIGMSESRISKVVNGKSGQKTLRQVTAALNYELEITIETSETYELRGEG